MNKQELLHYVEKKFTTKTPPEFNVGDTIKVHVRITEGDATRVQVFEGIVISFSGNSGTRNFTVRKISFGVGVERCFPLYSPNVEKIDIIRSGHARRAKLYYLRDRIGRAAKLDEKENVSTEIGKALEKKAPAAPAAAELAVAKDK